jgi:hypothetical protein
LKRKTPSDRNLQIKKKWDEKFWNDSREVKVRNNFSALKENERTKPQKLESNIVFHQCLNDIKSE